jgi:hypothetical protein
MKVRNLVSFSFKTEPIWMLGFNFAIIIVGLLIALVVTLLRYLQF